MLGLKDSHYQWVIDEYMKRKEEVDQRLCNMYLSLRDMNEHLITVTALLCFSPAGLRLK